MKPCLIAAIALFVPLSVQAQAAKSCEDLKSEITAKIEANGVKSYTLEIVPKDQDAEGKVVGTCGGGTKKIVYHRTTATSSAPAEAKKS